MDNERHALSGGEKELTANVFTFITTENIVDGRSADMSDIIQLVIPKSLAWTMMQEIARQLQPFNDVVTLNGCGKLTKK